MKISNTIKKIAAVALVAVVTVGMYGCGQKKEESALDKIKSNGTLVIGTAPGYPPFEFMSAKDGKGDLVGSDIDLGNKIGKDIGVKVEYKTMDFDALIPALQAGKVDMVISGMTPNEKRKKSIDFSDIYYSGTNALIVASSKNDIPKTEDELKKLKLGVQKGSVQEAYALETLKAENVKSLTTIPDLIQDLKNGNIDAVIANKEVGGINIKQYDGIKLDTNLEMKSFNGGESSAVGLKKGDNKTLIESINKTIKELKDSGEYKKIMEKNIDLAGSVK